MVSTAEAKNGSQKELTTRGRLFQKLELQVEELNGESHSSSSAEVAKVSQVTPSVQQIQI